MKYFIMIVFFILTSVYYGQQIPDSPFNLSQPLPVLLSFDPTSNTFSGIPDGTGKVTIKLTAAEDNNAAVSQIFIINVIDTAAFDYLGQTPPGSTAIPFSTGKSAQPGRLEIAGVFSRDGKEFYFTVISQDWKTRTTYVRKYTNGKWTDEEVAEFSKIPGGSTETFITNENNRIVFPSGDNTLTSDGWLKTDFYITERSGSGWTTPKKLSNTINDIEVQWHPTISDSGHIYFGSKGAVYVADHINDTTYSNPVKLTDTNINMTGYTSGDPFISPDESYIIFSSNRPGGYGSADLYISFRNKNNSWSKAVNLGSNINSVNEEFSSYVTPNGKYLLFVRDIGNGTERHIYWVSTGFIDSIKSTITKVEGEKTGKANE